MLEIQLSIPWRIIPKNRHYRRRKQGGFYLSKEFKEFQKNCDTWLLQFGNQVIHGPVRVDMNVYYKDMRWWSDEDNLQKTIGDMLQRNRFIDNDKLIHWGSVDRLLTPGKEGAEICIRQKV